MSQRFRNSILALVCGALLAASAIPQEQPAQPDSPDKYRNCALQARMFDGYCWVSMVDLIANPALFDGMKIMVLGYVHVEFEGRGIYLHEDDFHYSITRNGLWLGKTTVDLSKCQDTYADVRGTFRAGIGGHFDAWSGTLDQVVACRKLEARTAVPPDVASVVLHRLIAEVHSPDLVLCLQIDSADPPAAMLHRLQRPDRTVVAGSECRWWDDTHQSNYHFKTGRPAHFLTVSDAVWASNAEVSVQAADAYQSKRTMFWTVRLTRHESGWKIVSLDAEA